MGIFGSVIRILKLLFLKMGFLALLHHFKTHFKKYFKFIF
ncbi:putative membrane protein [Helicobacter pylori Hp H-42]|uniref:Membrane protein n=1 Tax=Helicobacter pylori Hp H-42 TaxID=992047 RepID=A0AB33XHF6_HELPX|nr:putative membrane protein [Helicobacter pylori Hp H-42]